MVTFFLVAKLMLPITKSDKKTRSKFQRFLFKGFADINELKAAIFANNPNLTAEQRKDVEYDLDQMNSFIESASSTSSIVSGMVHVVDANDLAFMGQWRYDQESPLMESINDADLVRNESLPEEPADDDSYRF